MLTVETLPEPSGPGSVVLEIGGGVGAVAVYVADALAGREIEIRAVGEAWRGNHVAVLERVLPAGPVWAALFPGLAEGDYEVRLIGSGPTDPTAAFGVTGGRVTTVHWMSSGLASHRS